MRFALAFRRLKSPAGVQLVAALPTVGLRQTTDERRQRGPRAAVDRYPIKIRAKKFINQTRSWNAFNRPCRAGDSSHRFCCCCCCCCFNKKPWLRCWFVAVGFFFCCFVPHFRRAFRLCLLAVPTRIVLFFLGVFFFLGLFQDKASADSGDCRSLTAGYRCIIQKKKLSFLVLSRSANPRTTTTTTATRKKRGKKKTKQKSTTATTRKGERATHLERTVFLFCFHFYYFSPSLSVSFFLFSLVLGFLPFEAPVKRISSFSSSSSFFLLFCCCCCCCCCWEETKKKKRKKEKKRKEERRYGATCSEINDSVGASLSRPATNANRHPLST